MSMQIGLETPVANFSFKNAVKLRLKAELRTGSKRVSKWVSSKIRERIVFGLRSETKSRHVVKRDG